MAASDHSRAALARADADFRRVQRARTRRRAVRRRRSLAGLALVAVLAVVLVLLTDGPGAARPTAARPTPRAAPVAVSPGSLPQTRAYPSGTSAHFQSLMASLWSGIVDDSVAPALPAFFPRGAYLQLKAIPDAGSDWANRLVRDYGLDITAAHALLGRHGASARLIAIDVPTRYGHWIEPGACYNSIGYYEMPNARVVYREDGQIRSFGIASMISWRGVWYVVHFGSIHRSGVVGAVDEPASGRGISAYSGTC